MKMRVTFEMPLPDGYEPFLRVIAEAHGYSAANVPDMSVEKFICDCVCKPQVTGLFHYLINNALSPYFGIAGRAQVEAVEAQFANLHTVEADIVES